MAARGITQVQLAAAVGVSQGSVSGWLNGAVPKLDKIRRIAEVLHLNPDYLLNPGRYINPLREAAAIAKEIGGPSQNAIFERTERELRSDMVREEPLGYEAIDWRHRALVAEGKLEAIRREAVAANERIEKLCKPDKEEKR